MRIVTFVKHVPASSVKPRLMASGLGIEEGGLAYEVSEADLYGIEEALHQRSLHKGHVTAITMGPGRAKEALHVAYAKGVDQAIHLVDEQSRGLNPVFNVLAAAEILKKLEFDMVFAGIQAEDDLQGQFGIGLAEVLGIPVITAVTEIRAEPGAKVATVIRELGGGFKEELEIDMPCVVTIQFGIRPVRYTPVMAIVKARARKIEQVAADSLPIAVPKEEGNGRLRVLNLSYPVDSGRCEFISGSPDEAARTLVSRLVEAGVV